jgi:hypothetical protein
MINKIQFYGYGFSTFKLMGIDGFVTFKLIDMDGFATFALTGRDGFVTHPYEFFVPFPTTKSREGFVTLPNTTKNRFCSFLKTQSKVEKGLPPTTQSKVGKGL